MVIERTGFSKDTLSGKAILITGAGGGIGFEAARALAYLGAYVIIAEIDEDKGRWAQDAINEELRSNRVTFYPIDITDDEQVQRLYDYIIEKYSALDVLINNATVAPIGGVDAVSISDWDKSYTVNLRAPILLTQKFLSGMKERNEGTIVFVPSSGAAPYMGAYEVFKSAQVELCNTLAGELEGTKIITYSIGPGLVKTETAQMAIETVSSLMGMTIAEFYEMNEKHIISAEEAGVGFAVSVVNADKYSGQEIGSIQALMDAGIYDGQVSPAAHDIGSSDVSYLAPHIQSIVDVFNEQYDGWHNRNLFERQWVLRDFKKTVGMAADNFSKLISNISEMAQKGNVDGLAEQKPWLKKLKVYYAHQHKLLQGYEKNPEELKRNSQVILSWMDELQKVIDGI